MKLSDNIWWTRKARIQTEKRLLSNSFQAQVLLLWYSFFSVFAAIYYLHVETPDALVNVAWIAFSILTLTVSGFISGLSFKERAALVKECYETLNGLRIRAGMAEKKLGITQVKKQDLVSANSHCKSEVGAAKPGFNDDIRGDYSSEDSKIIGLAGEHEKTELAATESLESIGKEYDQVLKVCENHTDSDFRAAICEAHLTEPSENLSKHPTRYTWFVFWLERLARVVLFALYVLLPVFVFFGIRFL